MCPALPYWDAEQLPLLPRLRADGQLCDDDAGSSPAVLYCTVLYCTVQVPLLLISAMNLLLYLTIRRSSRQLPLSGSRQTRDLKADMSAMFENVWKQLTPNLKPMWSRTLPNDLREYSLDYILIARGSTLLATQLYSGGALPESDYYRLREYKVHQSLSIWLRCPYTWSCKQCLMILWMRLCTVL